METDCLFCKIAAKKEATVIVWENDEFIAIKNKFPVAPIHLLVIPKEHVSKRELALLRPAEAGLRRAKVTDSHFWSKMMVAVFEVIRQTGLDKTGYKLVNNGAGYNHFDHEHIHVLGGTKGEPAGNT